MSNPAKPQEWDEFHDPGVVNWKRVRSVIEHENHLINHRIGWLLSSQAFLFAAFALIFQAAIANDLLYARPAPDARPRGAAAGTLPEARRPEYVGPVKAVLFVIPLVGFLVCLYILVTVDAAHRHTFFMEKWWICHHLGHLGSEDDLHDVEKLAGHPPINGMFDQWIYHVFGTRWIPVPFIIGWVTLLVVVVLEYILRIERSWVLVATCTVALLGLGGGGFRWLREKKHQPHRLPSREVAPGSAGAGPGTAGRANSP